MNALFPDLPAQTPPATLYSDEHALERCARCNATGIEHDRRPAWKRNRDPNGWDTTCRGCHGAGRVLRYLGPITNPTHPTAAASAAQSEGA